MYDYKIITDALIKGKKDNLATLIQNAIDQGESAKDILDTGLIASMNVVGEKMETGEMFIPEVLMAAKIMSTGVDYLKPMLGADDLTAKGKVIIGTVKGDLHDIGKNLVALMCEGAGFEVINLGVNVSPDQFVSAIRDNNADMLCLSALLTTTMPEMKKTVKAIEASGLREKIKIMIGGAPVTQAFAEEIGADAYSADAGGAARTANELLS
ncbi:MAG: cobalamin-binding protein [Desulfobacteraceae bacterium]|nr:cobalamin-binding protein [Desulfobacteraceae bacterium]